jgi:hypothetical protein
MSVNTKNWQELKKPNTLEIKDGGDRQRKVTFVAEPLERGFGLTLGNALRRVLLSSRSRALRSPRSRSRTCCTSSPRLPACART